MYHVFSRRSLAIKIATTTLIWLSLNGCSQRTAPAPVIEIYQGKSYQDFEEAGFKGDNYVVQKGDTLFSIAWYAGEDYQDIARLNHLKKPYNIFPGQQLKLRNGSSRAASTTQKNSGQTTNHTTKQSVDHKSKQAYGTGKQFVNKGKQSANVDQNITSVANWLWPTKGRLLKGFSLKDEGNKGIDIAGGKDQPIVAAADGKVVYTGSALRGYGNLVIIKHDNEYLTAYAHNSKILVHEQQQVKAGQQIGLMGSSGTNEVKLHFEVRFKGKSVNPLNYLPKQ